MEQMFKKLLLISAMSLFSVQVFADYNRTVAKEYLKQEQIEKEQAQLNIEQEKLVKETNQLIEAQKKPLIGLDLAEPYGYMPDTTSAFSVLQSKDKLNNLLVLGGELELDAQTWGGGYSSTSPKYHQGSGITFSTLDLFFVANLNSYFTGAVMLQNNLPGNSISIGGAFFNLGDLSRSPFYFTLGNNYLPFGIFDGNGPWSNALTTTAFRAQANQAILGCYKYGINTNLGVYQVNNKIKSNLNSFLLNTSYNQSLGKFNMSLGAGYISDIRGTTSSLGNAFTGDHPIYNSSAMGVVDVNVALNYDQYWIYSEYVSSLRGAQDSLAGNSSVGDLSAWMLSLAYNPTIWKFPTNIQLSYSQTYNMADLPFALNGAIASALNTTAGAGMQHQWLASFSMQVFRNLIYVGPEFQYARLYNGQNTWAGTLDLTAYF